MKKIKSYSNTKKSLLRIAAASKIADIEIISVEIKTGMLSMNILAAKKGLHKNISVPNDKKDEEFKHV